MMDFRVLPLGLNEEFDKEGVIGVPDENKLLSKKKTTKIKMITLSKKLKQSGKKETDNTPKRISIRDKLLVKEVTEMEENLPKTCQVVFEDHDKLHKFFLIVTPDESYWQGGKFKFDISVPEEYNIMPPQVRCCNRIWHPNISESGEVCLSLLRQSSYDSLGWAPTRKLKDVVWGINSLFSDLTNFDDPLNVDAADHYSQNKDSFKFKVREYIQMYAKR